MISIILAAFAAVHMFALPAPPSPDLSRTAPPRPVGYTAPPALLDRCVWRACKNDGDERCEASRGKRIRELAQDLWWVGLWYQTTWQLPQFTSWWLPLHAAREARFKPWAVGDHGRAVGLLQIHRNPWVSWWLRETGRTLNRLDPYESARALMHAVAISYHRKTLRACPETKPEKLFRLSVARTTRGPWSETRGVRVPRCNFWILDRNGNPKETAGITADWARAAFMGTSL